MFLGPSCARLACDNLSSRTLACRTNINRNAACFHAEQFWRRCWSDLFARMWFPCRSIFIRAPIRIVHQPFSPDVDSAFGRF